ncbi:MAG: AMP-binding protein [Cyanobium sp.]
MTLLLARHLEDPALLLPELQDGWRRGALVALAMPQERAALQAAVLGRCAAAADREAARRRRDRQPWPPMAVQGPGVVLGSGGSSGGRRWCLQPLEHLWASADACGLWLAQQGLDPAACLHLNALPLHHVSGLMPLLRAERWRAELRWLPPELMRRPADLAAAAPLPRGRPVLLSLVPTQLHRLLESPEAVRWLAGCCVIWMGGAALTADLAERARSAGLPLAPCYGATETAAMVCALPPQRFLAGEEGCGAPLADVELQLEGPAGAIAVRSARISPGWFEAGRLQPFRTADGWWRSGDAGVWIQAGATSGTACAPRPAVTTETVRLPDGHCPDASDASDKPTVEKAVERAVVTASASLLIRGRLDGAMHSGGETIFPEQVRQHLLHLIQATDLPVAELLLLAEGDPEWGERLVALVRWQTADTTGTPVLEAEWLQRLAAVARLLPPPQRPRRWLPCPSLQPGAAGKWEVRRWREWLQRPGSGDL